MYSSRPSQQFSAILVIGIVVVFTSQIPNVDAYYCDDNLCSAEQFCCGENICCNYVNNTSFVISGIICVLISVIVVCIVLFGFFQLLLALIAIYFSDSRRSDQLQDVEQDDEHNHNHSRHGSVADIVNSHVNLLYFIKRLSGALFPAKESRLYLYSPQSKLTTSSSASLITPSNKEGHADQPFH